MRWEAEDAATGAILRRLASANPASIAGSALCLPHLELPLDRLGDASVRGAVLLQEAALMERTAEDMQRHAIKHDGLRRDLASEEESRASLASPQLLVGHRSVNAVFTLRNLL